MCPLRSDVIKVTPSGCPATPRRWLLMSRTETATWASGPDARVQIAAGCRSPRGIPTAARELLARARWPRPGGCRSLPGCAGTTAIQKG